MRRPARPLLIALTQPAAHVTVRPVVWPVRIRLLLAGGLLCVLLATLPLALTTSRHAPVAPASAGAASRHLTRLPPAASGAISSALGADSSSYRIKPAGGGFQATNIRQHLTVRFSAEGARLRSGVATLGLALRGLGYGAALAPVAGGTPTASANRVVYDHPQLSEWYVNGPLGLEQGFALARAPAGSPGTGPLTLSLATSGSTRASLADGGQAIVLKGPGGSSLRYGALVATDARHRTLPSRLELAPGRIILRVDTRGARYPVRIDPLIQAEGGKLTGGGEEGAGLVGFAVALSADGNTALVGGPGDNGLTGAVWVFTRSGGVWSQQGPKLTGASISGKGGEPCNEETEVCSFGRSVALSGDGNTAIVGSPREPGVCPRIGGECARMGAAWVYTRSEEGSWTLQAKLTGGTEETLEARFGRSVALSGDGNTALVGAPANSDGVGSAWVFTRTGSSWTQQGPRLRGGGELTGSAHLGASAALSGDGNTALVGAPGDNEFTGAAWAFTRSGSTWSRQGPKLTSPSASAGTVGSGSHLGYSVALSADGTTALLGGRLDGSRAGAAWAFTLSGSSWTQQGPKLTAGPEGTEEAEFGSGVALSRDGNLALVGAQHDNHFAGAAWEFTRSEGTWIRRPEKLTSGEHSGKGWFGASVALSADAGVALIGAPHESEGTGSAWPYVGVALPPPPPPPPPAVTSITPTSGPTTGGTSVKINGTGFVTGAKVTIGTEATSVEVLSETEITAKTSAAPAGEDEVVVSDSRGTSTGGPNFTYQTAPVKQKSNPEPEEPEEEPLFSEITPGSEVLGTIATALPPPQLGVTGNVVPSGGVVLVLLPGSSKFIALTKAMHIPFGSIIDATRGRVTVTTIGPNGRLQIMVFYQGEFKLTQARNGVVLATLMGGDFSVCPTARERAHSTRAVISRASKKHTVRKLWAEGHGSYSTKGNYAAGAVLGTRWLTADLCGGTLIKVSTDRVRITNLLTHKKITVKAGHSYLAKAP